MILFVFFSIRLIGSGGKAINCHGNGTKHNICPEIETDEYRIVTELRLGRAPSDYSLIVVPGKLKVFVF